MFKKRPLERMSGELSPSANYSKQILAKNALRIGDRTSSPTNHTLNISEERKYLVATKVRQNSQNKHRPAGSTLEVQSIFSRIQAKQTIKPLQVLSVCLQASKQLKIIEFKYSNSTTIKQLTTFLRKEIRQPNVIFQGPSVMLDYLLTIQNQLVINLKARKLSLKVIHLRTHQFVNNPLVNFRILKCVGAGGFSKVFLVEAYGIYMALKVIPKKLLRDNDKEVIVLSQKNILIEMKRHPFITKIHYAFETTNNICLALEYCPGGELFNLLKKIKRMKEQEAQFYFLEVLLALKALHEQGIVYRDLKPQNIIIDHEGHVRLADFGLSKQLKQEITYSFCGSAEYMAPEMLLKEGHDFSIDYYCIGALLYELVTGLPPYYCKNQQQLFSNILTSSLQFPDQKVTLSPGIKSILRGLLHKNPKKRLGSQMGIMQIFAHPWITNLSIPDLVNKKMKPPYKPDLLVYNFDDAEYEGKEASLIKQLEKEGKQYNVKELMFDDFYFESKEMQMEIERIRNSERRESVNKDRTPKSPQSRLYLKHTYESISSPKHYAFIKTRSPLKQDIYRNPEKDALYHRYLSEHEKSKLSSNDDIYYRRSVQNQRERFTQSRGSSFQRKKISPNSFVRQSHERKNHSRDILHNSYKFVSPYSPKNVSAQLGMNVQSPRRIEQISRVKSSQVFKRGFIQKQKLKSYFNQK